MPPRRRGRSVPHRGPGDSWAGRRCLPARTPCGWTGRAVSRRRGLSARRHAHGFAPLAARSAAMMARANRMYELEPPTWSSIKCRISASLNSGCASTGVAGGAAYTGNPRGSLGAVKNLVGPASVLITTRCATGSGWGCAEWAARAVSASLHRRRSSGQTSDCCVVIGAVVVSRKRTCRTSSRRASTTAGVVRASVVIRCLLGVGFCSCSL